MPRRAVFSKLTEWWMLVTSPGTHKKKTRQGNRSVKLFDCRHHFTVCRATGHVAVPTESANSRDWGESLGSSESKTWNSHSKRCTATPKCVTDTWTLLQPPESHGSSASVPVSIGACLPKHFLFTYCMIKTTMVHFFSPWAMFSQICSLRNCFPETLQSLHSNTVFRYYK